MRILCVLAVLAFAVGAVGWAAPCGAGCADGAGDRCPPGCPTCTCATHVSTTALPSAVAVEAEVPAMPEAPAPDFASPVLLGRDMIAPPLRPPIA